MKIQLPMSIAEYKSYCQSFFDAQPSKEQINNSIRAMSVEEFQEWLMQIIESYQSYYDPVRALVKIIRGSYDPVTDYDKDIDDPLHAEEIQAQFVPFRNVHNETYLEYIDSLPAFVEKEKEQQAALEKKHYEDSLKVVVDGVHYRALKAIAVYWSGWECDSTAWIVEKDGVNRVVMSNHGHTQFVEKGELEEKINEYKKAIAETQEALDLL
jgi:hypothetical protein